MDNYKYKPEDFWKQKLTPEQYHVLREAGTEAPFTGRYVAHDKVGNYYCAACGQLLFTSDSKYYSGCGWPSFDKLAKNDAVELKEDTTRGMVRTEVKCSNCGSHLGHLFDDGPTETGARYCINSIALDFKPKQ